MAGQIVTTLCPESRAPYRARSGVERTMAAWDLACCNGQHLMRLVNDSLDLHEIESGVLAFNLGPLADCPRDGDNGGSGLGLRTANAIVEPLGGQIGFEAGSDTGTTLFSGQPE